MQTVESVDVLIYRVKDKGLEVFLLNAPQQGLTENWQVMRALEPTQTALEHAIQLEPVVSADGETRQAFAIEADWHDIPSLRALIYEDLRVAKQKTKNKLKNIVPEMEQGAYFAIKEAFRKVMPDQYAALKELKDILLEKNQTTYV